MVEYKETFLIIYKSLLPYFIEFSDDRSILHTVYLEDCIVDRPDKRFIIMITYDESTFFANHSRQSLWSFEGHGIL